ncbi:MAG: transporter, family, beta-lactamase induction signal transducer AmpG, partial [Variibacter sp.]|nr:transporter, family, beta-lactamase induction signal transducer AmpG [Variibacter sp.]
MTAPATESRAEKGKRRLEAFTVYLQPRVLIVMFLGFASGLPLALSGSTLQIWARESGVDLGTIGLFALVGTPYTLKFLWAPVVDALGVPVLSRLLGRRRGWLIFSQLLLVAAILFLATCDPAVSPAFVALGALLVATASATQDIVIDAFRVESLPQREQAAGMASYVAAYRIGMLVSTLGVLFLVSGFETWGSSKSSAWVWGFVAMAALIAIGMVASLVATEPEPSRAAEDEQRERRDTPLTRLAKAATGAFSEILAHELAVVVLLFVVLYKLCDAFAGTMTAAFVIDLGFTRTDYATIVKGVG